jgi:hypothetical protein
MLLLQKILKLFLEFILMEIQISIFTWILISISILFSNTIFVTSLLTIQMSISTSTRMLNSCNFNFYDKFKVGFNDIDTGAYSNADVDSDFDSNVDSNVDYNVFNIHFYVDVKVNSNICSNVEF